jgi:hypothetical protein
MLFENLIYPSSYVAPITKRDIVDAYDRQPCPSYARIFAGTLR